MKIFRFMTLHAIESVTKEEAKEISSRKHKNFNFRFLLFATLIAIATGSFFVACNADDQFSEDTVKDVDTEMREILGKHLTVENNRYVLNLSEADAMKSGVSQSLYAKFSDEIAELNDFIESTENDPNMSVNFNTENSQDINYKTIRLKSGSENDVNGYIFSRKIYVTTQHTEHVIYMPLGTTHLKFAFKTSASTYVKIQYQVLELQSARQVLTKYGETPEINFTIQIPMTLHLTLSKTTDGNCWVEIFYKK
jgi:hypothetical protein